MGRTGQDPAESALCNALLVSGLTAGFEPRKVDWWLHAPLSMSVLIEWCLAVS